MRLKTDLTEGSPQRIEPSELRSSSTKVRKVKPKAEPERKSRTKEPKQKTLSELYARAKSMEFSVETDSEESCKEESESKNEVIP
jgi:hypothetical protein